MLAYLIILATIGGGLFGAAQLRRRGAVRRRAGRRRTAEIFIRTPDRPD